MKTDDINLDLIFCEDYEYRVKGKNCDKLFIEKKYKIPL